MNTKIETDSYGNTTVIANSLTAAKKALRENGLGYNDRKDSVIGGLVYRSSRLGGKDNRNIKIWIRK